VTGVRPAGLGVNVSTSVSAPDRVTKGPGAPAARLWYAAAGLAAVVVCLLPPVTTLAQRYVVAESVQFLVFAMVAPALVVLGAPWRLLRLSGPDGTGGPAGRLAAVRRDQRSFLRASGYLIVFAAVTVTWRLPPVLDALARHQALMLAELVTVAPAGLGLWLELLPSPPLAPRLPRPHRAAVAALAMWFTWAVAYVVGFHNSAIFTAYSSVPGRAIGLVADQEMAVEIIWAVTGLCFVPVVIVTMMGWLSSSDDPDTAEELQRIVRDEAQRAMVKGWGAPVRSWGKPSQGSSGRAR
jgi:cytochrome c oxidase assembly factor CtaG